MNNSEELVANELSKQGLACQRFSKSEIKNGKTPDFRVFKDNQFGFYCEVKEVKKDDWALGLRNDPIFNRLTDDIHTAVKQFDAVNPDNKFPNVLAFVNNDHMCGSLDLLGVLTGGLLLEGGGMAEIYYKFSKGRIKNEKDRIHLYLWYDSFKANKVLFNQNNDSHLKKKIICAAVTQLVEHVLAPVRESSVTRPFLLMGRGS